MAKIVQIGGELVNMLEADDTLAASIAGTVATTATLGDVTIDNVGITGGTIDVFNGTALVALSQAGTVVVSSIPAVSGTVVVSSAPAVSGTVLVSTLEGGTVNVSGFAGGTVYVDPGGAIIKIAGTSVAAGTTAYSTGDLIGTLLTISSATREAGAGAILTHICIQDLTNQKSALDVVLFDADPSNTTFTDNGTLDVADADITKIIGHVSFAATDYVSFADNAVGTLKSLAMEVVPATGTSLYAALVSRGTPTYAANELSISFGFIQD